MRIKDRPEDFVVEELPSRAFASHGPFFVYRATKTDLTTQQMVASLARASQQPPDTIRYAGLKDRRAVTTQYLTSPRALLPVPGIVLEQCGFTDAPLQLGELASNRFRIVVRDVHAVRECMVPNYYGDQRFSTDNVRVGLLVLRGQFREAADAFAAEYPAVQERLRHGQGPVSALHGVPRRTLLLYVHAVQSMLWNEAVSASLADAAVTVPYAHGLLRFPSVLPDVSVPLVGAAQPLGSWESWYAPVLAQYALTPQHFLVRPLPFLTLEGGSRSLRMDVREKRLHHQGDVVTLELELGPGCYASVCVAAWCS